jgi:hypothetical protein
MAMMRGLFEYQYQATGLTLRPRIPPGINRLEQHFPVRFGRKQLYLSTVGAGKITAVTINGRPWKAFNAETVSLPYDRTPEVAFIQVCLGGAQAAPFSLSKPSTDLPAAIAGTANLELGALETRVARLRAFCRRMTSEGQGRAYESAHAQLAVDYLATTKRRFELAQEGRLEPLADSSQQAADKSYVHTTSKLCDGIEQKLESYQKSTDPRLKRIYELWAVSAGSEP